MNPLEQTILDWLSFLRHGRGLSAHTITAYGTDLRHLTQFMTEHLGHPLSLSSLQDLTIQDYRAWLSQRNRQDFTKRSTARALSSLKQFSRFLKQHHAIDLKALEALSSPRLEKTLPRPLTVQQASDLLAQESNEEPWIAQRDKALFSLLYGAGLRIDEALTLNQGDLGPSLMILGKGRKERQVPLLPQVLHEIEQYLSLCPYPRAKQAPLFYGMRGKRLNPTMAQKYLQHYRRQMGLPESVTPHALRHSFASHMLQSSKDLRSVQQLLGHASLSTTQIYTQLDEEHLLDAFQNFHPRSRGKSGGNEHN